jgi:hypothetical protein
MLRLPAADTVDPGSLIILVACACARGVMSYLGAAFDLAFAAVNMSFMAEPSRPSN